MPNLREWLQRTRTFLEDELWYFEPERPSQLGIVRVLQFSIMVGEGFVRDQLLLRASALTYFAVLSIVPMLVIVAAVLTAFGVTENVLGPVIDQIAVVSEDAGTFIRSTIDNANLGALGTIGAVSLLVTTVLGIGNVETTLNHIWGVQHERSWINRLAYYLAVLILSPLLIGAGLSATTIIADQAIVSHMLQYPLFAAAYEMGLQQAPILVFALAFIFLYAVLPNTRVSLPGAILGGLFSALAVNGVTKAYVGYAVGAARADVLYGSLSQLPFLFVWIYTVWAIVLLGAEISFAYQNLAGYRREVRSRDVGASEREALGLHLAALVAQRFRAAAEPLGSEEAAELLDAPVRVIRDVEARLVGSGLLARLRLADDGQAVTLGRPAEKIHVADVLAAIRGARDEHGAHRGLGNVVESVLSELDENSEKGAGARTLSDLLDTRPLRPEVDPPGARG